MSDSCGHGWAYHSAPYTLCGKCMEHYEVLAATKTELEILREQVIGTPAELVVNAKIARVFRQLARILEEA